MPIKLPSTLPAYDVLTREGVMVMPADAAEKQDIRPMKIGLLNLMPKKIQTENQFARLIGATPLQIELQLIRMSEHQTKNTAAEHMEEFYRPFQEVKDQKFDGLIITGAPIEHMPFEDVTYWDELKEVMDWTQTNVHMTFGVCWGGMAMINHFHGVSKHMLDAKAFGCFRHMNLAPQSPYLRGFSDEFVIPVSRWTEMK
ncbi:MAG: homoserine O-succinyltransferase, partial [Boseongicola sp.]|nr:homoserine O-succinyltransferase [Boseongicola sp.]